VSVRKILRPVVSVSLLGWVAWHTDWARVAEAFARLQVGWWLAAVLVLVGTQVVSALRWGMLAAPLGFAQPLRRMAGFYFIGMFFNLVLPTSVGGDVVRAWYLAGRPGRRLAAFVSVLLDRLSGLLVLLALAGLGVALSPLELPPWIHGCVGGALACIVGGLACLPLVARLPLGVGRTARDVLAALAAVRSPRLVVLTTLLSLAVQVANVAIVWLIGEALGAPVPFTYYWVLVPMVTLLTLLPISVNGMGVREGAMVLFLAPVGVGRETALALAFLWFAVFATVSLSGGLVYQFGHFPSPAAGAGGDERECHHGPVGRDSDQGRAGQPRTAA
jgi:uncharacterized membrane protein YbhN (UPF0104 family)